MEDLWFMG